MPILMQIKDDIRLPTSLGERPLSAILAASDQRLYIQPMENSGYQGILYKAQQIPLISGYLFGVAAFCERYSQLDPRIKVVHLGDVHECLTGTHAKLLIRL